MFYVASHKMCFYKGIILYLNLYEMLVHGAVQRDKGVQNISICWCY